MRAGVLISLTAHTALIALALWGLPWLKAHPGDPVSVVQVQLVGPDTLAALEAAARRAVVMPAPSPAREAPQPDLARPEMARSEPAGPESAEPETQQPALPELDPGTLILAPAFDPSAPLGLPQPDRSALLDATPEPVRDRTSLLLAPSAAPRDTPERPWPRPALEAEPEQAAVEPRPPPPPATAAAGVAGQGAAEARAEYWAAVHAAIVRAQIYPRAARSRGIEGAVILSVVVGRDGRLRAARLERSSGAVVLDQACLDAARSAILPPPPAELSDADLAFTVTVGFEIAGN